MVQVLVQVHVRVELRNLSCVDSFIFWIIFISEDWHTVRYVFVMLQKGIFFNSNFRFCVTHVGNVQRRYATIPSLAAR